ncbi:tetratricopeptide repeat protein [Mariniflexile ostreae]|uniref:Tetratricopeptide repeat protein n=1 Tax=Mariniflexile ostreae TaxID=1520892 RepID=A0ABV5FEM7_9FLAO
MSDTCLKRIENYWKAKTEASNILFNKGRYEEALLGYRDALYRSEVLNNNRLKCQKLEIPFIQLYIISCNNIANTYEELGNLIEAEKMLKQSIYFTLHLMSSKSIVQNDIHSELKRATLTYYEFTEKNGHLKINKQQLFNRLTKELSLYSSIALKN